MWLAHVVLLCAALASGAVSAQCARDPGHDPAGPGAVGTIFALRDETGAVVTSAEIFDRPALLYFGYTFCPDICPTDIARNAAAVDLLAARGSGVRPVFITLDPGRDTPETLAEFTDMIHPDMIGLTGTAAQIDAVAEAYGVVHSAAVPDEEYYLLDHSTYTYLVAPGGRVAERYSRVLSPEALADAVACHLTAWQTAEAEPASE